MTDEIRALFQATTTTEPPPVVLETAGGEQLVQDRKLMANLDPFTQHVVDLFDGEVLGVLIPCPTNP